MTSAQMRNISAGGVYFCTRTELRVGQEIKCTMMLPPKLTLAPSPTLITCQAKVLRLDTGLPHQTIGVAAQVHKFDFSVLPYSSFGRNS